MGALKTKQINLKNKQNKKTCGSQQAIVLGFEQCNALRKNNRVRMEPVENRAGEAGEETVNSYPDR